MENLTLSTCSYLSELNGPRAKLVRQAFLSWHDMLGLPFSDRIFLDDHSPDQSALKMLDQCGLKHKFNTVEYETSAHPLHSNFGIVKSLSMANTEYIMHLDDDVLVAASADKCRRYIDSALNTLERDRSLMGFNLLTLEPGFHGEDWLPGVPYDRSKNLCHPKRYYGTAASIIRRRLLDRVNYQQIVAWGATQPSNWEKLVTYSSTEFLTGELTTPFRAPPHSYYFKATARIPARDRLMFLIKNKIKAMLGYRKTRKS